MTWKFVEKSNARAPPDPCCIRPRGWGQPAVLTSPPGECDVCRRPGDHGSRAPAAVTLALRCPSRFRNWTFYVPLPAPHGTVRVLSPRPSQAPSFILRCACPSQTELLTPSFHLSR